MLHSYVLLIETWPPEACRETGMPKETYKAQEMHGPRFTKLLRYPSNKPLLKRKALPNVAWKLCKELQGYRCCGVVTHSGGESFGDAATIHSIIVLQVTPTHAFGSQSWTPMGFTLWSVNALFWVDGCFSHVFWGSPRQEAWIWA